MTESKLTPPNHCSLCGLPHTDNEDWVQGYIGAMPIAFCELCTDGLIEMVEHLKGEKNDV